MFQHDDKSEILFVDYKVSNFVTAAASAAELALTVNGIRRNNSDMKCVARN